MIAWRDIGQRLLRRCGLRRCCFGPMDQAGQQIVESVFRRHRIKWFFLIEEPVTAIVIRPACGEMPDYSHHVRTPCYATTGSIPVAYPSDGLPFCPPDACGVVVGVSLALPDKSVAEPALLPVRPAGRISARISAPAGGAMPAPDRPRPTATADCDGVKRAMQVLFAQPEG